VTRWGVLYLTERTDLTEHIAALFRAHRTPPAYRYHRTLLLMKIPIRRQKTAYIQPIGVSRWSRPFPSGEGKGEGPAGVGGGATQSQNAFGIQRTQSVRNFIIIRYCTTYHFFLLLPPLTNIKKIVQRRGSRLQPAWWKPYNDWQHVRRRCSRQTL